MGGTEVQPDDLRCIRDTRGVGSLGSAGRGLRHRSALADVSRELRWDLRLGHVPSGTISSSATTFEQEVETDRLGSLIYRALH